MTSEKTMKMRGLMGKRARAGSYSAFACAIVIALCVLVNGFFASLPSSVTQLDLTSQSLYSLSDQTKRIVRSVDNDVNLYILATTGYEDASIMRLLERYADLNDHIKVTPVDPAVKPTFLDAYDLSVSQLYENSVLVDANGRYRLVSYPDIYVTDYQMDYYSYNYTTTTSFDGENALTNAIHYVTNENLPKIYALSGHGESELSESAREMLSLDNMTLEKISLFSYEAIPEDASVILINAPTSDLSDAEAELMTAWLAEGGKILLLTNYIDEGEMTNLLSVTEYMGLTAKTGLIIEGDSNRHLARYPHYLLPEIENHEITDALKDGGYYILSAMSQPIEETEDNEANVTFLLTTSESAYLKAAGMNTQTTQKEDSDETGAFNVAATSQMGEGQLVWFSNGALLDENVDMLVSGANSNVFMNALNWMCEQPESISIRAKSMDAEGLVLTSSESSILSMLLIGGIPALLIGVGICVVIRRKRR
ncbi:MAG: hypothetical protein E7322_05445 [Clostridiales bacterium]|nr:hypothetical protein [Clostridiales bacterium]